MLRLALPSHPPPSFIRTLGACALSSPACAASSASHRLMAPSSTLSEFSSFFVGSAPDVGRIAVVKHFERQICDDVMAEILDGRSGRALVLAVPARRETGKFI